MPEPGRGALPTCVAQAAHVAALYRTVARAGGDVAYRSLRARRARDREDGIG